MASTAGGAFGFASGLIIQEFGYDDDVDETLRQAVEAETGTTLVDEDYEDVADSAIVWWRDDDGDLVDELVDAVRPLADHGRIWLLSPAAGTKGELAPGVVSESAQLAGLVQTKAERLGSWQGSCLVQRGAAKRS